MTPKLKASLSIVAGAGVWGLFWIPLRHLDDNGVSGLWAVAMTAICAAIAAVPAALMWGRKQPIFSRGTTIVGLGIGCSMVFYFAGVILSDVIRVIFLFYLLPVWATLTAWMLFGEKIRPVQLFSIALALCGVWLLLGSEGGLPLPQNLGDTFGLVAGFLWGLSLTLIRGHPDLDPFVNTAAPFVIGTPVALLLVGLLHLFGFGETQNMPDLGAFTDMLPLALMFGLLVLWPAMLGQVWGARHVSSPTAALLTMAEILLATLSAWYLIGTSLTPISWLGGGIIILAVVLDLTAGYRAERLKPQ